MMCYAMLVRMHGGKHCYVANTTCQKMLHRYSTC
jgi:hypothetical protein